jgi:hypothetical protein
MLRRPRSFIPVLVFSATAMVAGLLAPAFAGVAAAAAVSGKPALDLCVVEPGFATPGDTYGFTTTGPKSFNASPTLQASGCGSFNALPSAGTYTVTQSQTASGWQLGGIYCYSVGAADTANGTVDQSSSSATVKVTGPTTCIFAEVQGSGGSSGGGSSSGGGFSGGSGSSSSGSSTTTTTKTGTGTTPTTIHHIPVTSICVTHPSVCVFKANGVTH